MPDTPIAGGRDGDYPSDMNARVAVLEQIAADTRAALSDIRLDLRDMRVELRDMRGDLRGMRIMHERDFRLAFGAVISVAIGLAYLIARASHWL